MSSFKSSKNNKNRSKTNFNILYIIPIGIIAYLFSKQLKFLLQSILKNLFKMNYSHPFISTFIYSAIITLVFLRLKNNSQKTIYLRDFALYHGDDNTKLSHKKMIEMARLRNMSDESVAFMERVQKKSEISGETYYTPKIMKDFPKNVTPVTLKDGKDESKEVMFQVVQKVLEKTKIDPKEIDILVTNSSLLCTTPSLSSFIVNKFKMRENIKSFSLGGMGCSAGIIALDLAKDMLKVHSNSYALVVSIENMNRSWYYGNDKSMLVTNTLFRVGGAGVIITNIPSKQNKMELLHVVRTHRGADDQSFNSIVYKEDNEGILGVSLSNTLVKVAGYGLKSNLTSLAPKVLPLSEKLKIGLNLFALKLLKNESKSAFLITIRNWLLNQKSNGLLKMAFLKAFSLKPEKDTIGSAYLPNFKKAFDHFCIHAGGKRIVEGVKMSLKLTEKDIEASKKVLNDRGNTSSSSIWYEMNEHLENSNVKKGHKLVQIGFGSGFKCNSAVWKSLMNFV